MRLLITGASGFLGQYVVAEALRRGHQVRAVVRPSGDFKRLPWHEHPAAELVRIDLRRQQSLADAVRGVDAVIHLAATKAGDFYTQFAGTVIATENLLKAMVEANVLRLVAISTFSVYEYLKTPSGTLITEDSPLESNPLPRDEYAQTKLIQEEIVREFEQKYGAQVTIIRPGMVYGRDNLWNACLGAELTGNLWLRIGARAQMPLTYVENCADAIVIAAERNEAIGQTLNIVDDDLPTQSVYAQKLAERLDSLPRTIPVNWTLMRSIAGMFWAYNQRVLKGRAKLPGIVVPARLHARFKPLHYTNARAKQVLDWQPRYSLDTALERSCSKVELLAVPDQTPSLQPS
ncbi:MAG TPA: epimerase [Cyanobacteria bacterium UBA8803]|nr:epimerase [Cyanobacteria bacterium UBA9273]HBL57847.1 epimerase [Cyanobacteria bacterium UBA8803]